MLEKQGLLPEKEIKWIRLLTVEPSTLFYFMALILSQILQMNLMLDKACKKNNFTDRICVNEVEAELIVSRVNTWKLVFISVLSVLFAAYVGPLTDKNPKYIRVFMVVPIVGLLLCDTMNYASVYFWDYWSPSVMAIYDIILVGGTGSYIVYSMICYSYVSHVSSKKDRTVRIGYLVLAHTAGVGIGNFISGYILQGFGYYVGFSICIMLQISSLISAIKLTEDIHVEHTDDVTQLSISSIICRNFSILTKKRTKNRQLLVIIILFTYPIVLGYPLGESSLMYLFLRHKFSWSPIEYGVYMSFKMAIKCFGTLICAEVLKRRLRLHDATIGIIGSISELITSITWITIYYSWQVYAATLIGIFEKVLCVVLISLGSKCVEPHEYGKLNSMFGLMNAVTPIFYPIYNEVYKNGIYTFPNSFFLISVTLTAPCIFIFGIMRYLSDKSFQYEYFINSS